MAEKLYKYNDSWVSYGYLHDTFGYTKEPSFEITYNSVNPWGERDTSGFLSGSLTDSIHSLLLFKNGMTGWYSLNEMALNGYYPDGATDATMRNGNVTSNAVYITDLSGTEYYLIQAAISDGWLTLDEWALLGWGPGSAVESPLCGSMGADYSESAMGYPAKRMERGGIEFTGSLRENVIPESGVVEEYVAPSMYDVWIESVDLANNVVIALRSVFTGLTAARANTIVNNAPTYLSRYNGYLDNQGGPYTQADAVTMKDNLQSRIPTGDTSTFGIRPVSA